MLFQPTNITPDVLGGAENGTVNVSAGLTISWQINGNSPMVGYRIAILANDVASTPKYNTNLVGTSALINTAGSGTVDSNLPVYPTNYKGEPNRYSITIDAATLSSAGISNGNEYKIAIRVFWDEAYADSAHSVRTSNYPLFLARGAAHVAITSPASGTTIATYNKTFTASYWQGTQYDVTDDPIEWVRWKIYDSADMGRTIYDSQKIYTQELQLDYDGFLNGRSYKIDLTIHNTVGQTAHTMVEYPVSWLAVETTDVAVATRLNNQSSAVKVSWTAADYIPADITGDVWISKESALISPGYFLAYNEKNGAALSISAPWALVMNTEIHARGDDVDVDILTVTMAGGGKHTIDYALDNRTLTVKGSNNVTVTSDLYVDANEGRRLKIYIDDTKILVYKYQATTGLVPSATLVPSNTLVPWEEDDPSMVKVAEVTLTGTQAAITEVKMGGWQYVDYIEVVSAPTTEQKALMKDEWLTDYEDNAASTMQGFDNIALLADYVNTLDAGNYTLYGIPIVGWEVYRKRKSEAFARHLCSLGLSQMEFYDYGCGSRMGKYTYFIYPRQAEGMFISSALRSNTIQPVFWNWSIVEATYDEDDDQYNVINEYIFRNNVSSGSVSNNNSPSVSQNFTQYPTVQMSSANYQSGTLVGLIGQVGYTSYVVQYGNSLVDLSERFKIPEQQILDDNGLATWENHGYAGRVIKLINQKGVTEYFDDKAQRDAIWNLSTTTNHLFLKSRIGDVIEIKIAGAITMETMDNTERQAIAANVPWVQINDAQDAHIVCAI